MFDNYIKLFTTDYYFMSALLNSLKWVLLVLVIQVPLAIIVAFVLSKRPRGWKLVRNTYIIPNIISTSAIGLIFLNLYDPARGAVTQIINSLSSSNDVNILASGGSAFWGVTFSFVLFGGTAMLLVLSQISAISPDLYEAARIDGANSFQIDTKIVLPLLKPIIGTIAILATNYGLLLYNEIALLTGGGPDKATYSLSYYIYQTAMGSSKLNFSLANTAGVVQFILGLVLVGLISKVFKMDKSHI
ncbi:sugar ABC transporter permease [Paludicola sp. MB14-C6]|uniref:carbohydrate ABC transporter permease n=1 Tax=Paludihabitans sp. MB14-C6 TaxID=3070656 RepID=UPI0027DD2747|nr:sugar ABC transporter permease [Paludicola sp. MB14-C6]WMJ22737.1 sugar ABC transporter permease [Paludicola sp. MB14-C6]